jgi:hypothetical protein
MRYFSNTKIHRLREERKVKASESYHRHAHTRKLTILPVGEDLLGGFVDGVGVLKGGGGGGGGSDEGEEGDGKGLHG